MPCYTPYGVRDKFSGQIVNVPCGRCPYCAKKRASAWSFRLMQEERHAVSALFVTLTYSPKNVRFTKNGFMTLYKRDVQLFMKRLRKSQQGSGMPSIKYYLAGEYGGNTYRPHYHIILFNADINKIQKAWDLGHVHYGKVEAASVGYTLKYICKPGRIPMHDRDDRAREFGLMSKGLGFPI